MVDVEDKEEMWCLLAEEHGIASPLSPVLYLYRAWYWADRIETCFLVQLSYLGDSPLSDFSLAESRFDMEDLRYHT